MGGIQEDRRNGWDRAGAGSVAPLSHQQQSSEAAAVGVECIDARQLVIEAVTKRTKGHLCSTRTHSLPPGLTPTMTEKDRKGSKRGQGR